MTNTNDFDLGRQIYLYGYKGREPFGFMCFGDDGQILCHKDDNEFKYEFDGQNLKLLSRKGQITVEFERLKNGQGFLRTSGADHYLTRVFGLGAPKSSNLPKVLVNTIPKAGTYLLAEALTLSGYSSLRLHLADSFFHNNQEVSGSEIHWDPDPRKVNIPADVITQIMTGGEYVVGHIGDKKILTKLKDQGIEIINVVRDPRSQLVSLFHFALSKQRPTPRSMLWRSLPDDQKFKAFLLSQDVKSIVEHNRILTSHGPFFCFEDIATGNLIEKGKAIFNSKNRRKVLSDIRHALSGAIGRPTSTRSERNRANDFDFYDDPAIEEFIAGPCGLKQYSEKYQSFLASGLITNR